MDQKLNELNLAVENLQAQIDVIVQVIYQNQMMIVDLQNSLAMMLDDRGAIDPGAHIEIH